jgi:hypothetical protein
VRCRLGVDGVHDLRWDLRQAAREVSVKRPVAAGDARVRRDRGVPCDEREAMEGTDDGRRASSDADADSDAADSTTVEARRERRPAPARTRRDGRRRDAPRTSAVARCSLSACGLLGSTRTLRSTNMTPRARRRRRGAECGPLRRADEET